MIPSTSHVQIITNNKTITGNAQLYDVPVPIDRNLIHLDLWASFTGLNNTGVQPYAYLITYTGGDQGMISPDGGINGLVIPAHNGTLNNSLIRPDTSEYFYTLECGVTQRIEPSASPQYLHCSPLYYLATGQSALPIVISAEMVVRVREE